MNKFTILLRREIWENKSSFIYLPIVVASLCAFFVISGIGALQIGGDFVNIDADINYKSNQITETYNVDDTFDSLVGRGLQDFSRQPEIAKRNALNGVYLAISDPLILTLRLVIIFYLVMSLYQDRKDRSILFWKSMPVSDFTTVLSKVITALIIVPAIYLACCMALHLVLLLVSTLSALGYDVPIWSTLWAPAGIITRWFEMASYLLIVGLWCLPFYYLSLLNFCMFPKGMMNLGKLYSTLPVSIHQSSLGQCFVLTLREFKLTKNSKMMNTNPFWKTKV